MAASYRPHNPGHDYYDSGVYLITLVINDRDHFFGELNNDVVNPGVNLSDVGQHVCDQWKKSEELQLKYGNKIKVACQVAMPDHWHGVIEVQERMTWSLGSIIQAVKSACTSYWRKSIGYKESPLTAAAIRHMSHEARRLYFASRPRSERPLFDDDYDDTICLSEQHHKAMVAYVFDNPRRAIICRLLPHFMQRCLHIVIDGVDYAAFGNLFLLRWARKLQVFCHRRARLSMLTSSERQQYGYDKMQMLPSSEATFETCVPYETTAAFVSQRDEWVAALLNGATVLVTPGISKGEQEMKRICIERSYPLIHIQKEPINAFWKPELSRFEACTKGSLLILAPWHVDEMGEVNGMPQNSDYSRFHNLNELAAQICAFEGEAKIVGASTK